jgi:hypothetical protein
VLSLSYFCCSLVRNLIVADCLALFDGGVRARAESVVSSVGPATAKSAVACAWCVRNHFNGDLPALAKEASITTF